MKMDSIRILLLLVAILQFTLLGFITLSGKKKAVTIFHGGLIMSVAMWSFGMMMYMQEPLNYPSILLWTRILYFAGFMSSIFFFLFALSYSRLRLNKTILWGTFFIGAVMGFLLFFTKSIISGIEILPAYRRVIQESGYWLYFIFFFIFYPSGFIVLLKHYFKAKNVWRKQLQYILLGLLPLVSLGSIINMIMPAFWNDFTYAWYGPLAGFVLVYSVSYAISHHRFLDLELSLQRAFSILLTGITLGMPLFISLLTFVFYPELKWWALSLAIILSCVGIFKKNDLFKYFSRFLNIVFFNQDKNSLELIQEAKSYFPNSLYDGLQLLKKALNVHDVTFVYATDAIHFEPLMGKKDLYLSDKNVLVQRLQQVPHELVRDEIEYELSHANEEEVEVLQNIKQEMENLFISVAFPLSEYTEDGKKRLVGIILLEEKIDEKLFPKQLLHETKVMLEDVTVYISTLSTKEQIQKKVTDEKTVQQEFIKGLMHEIGTPLVYAENLSMIFDWVEKDPTNKKYLKEAEKGISSVNRIIKKIADAFAWDMGQVKLQKSTITVHQLLKYAFEDLSEEQKKNITLRKNIHLSKKLHVDVKAIVQVIQEIITNALFFRHTQRKPRLIISCREKNNKLFLRFQDNGKGILRKNWLHVFAPLFVESKSRNRKECGIGCGLTIARGVVKAHDGQIYIESSDSKTGTLMIIELPLKVVRKAKKKTSMQRVVHLR